MKILIENRVEQAIRHLQQRDVKRVLQKIELLDQANSNEEIKKFNAKKLPIPDENLFMLRVTSKLRLIFRYGDREELIIEDLISNELLQKLIERRQK